MTQKVLTYKDENYNVDITVRQATVADGIHRSVLVAQMYTLPAVTDTKLASESRITRLLLLHTYPACLSVSTFKHRKSVKKLEEDMSTDAFLALPDVMVFQWEQIVFELNPHWDIQRAAKESVEETKGEALEPNDEKN